MSRFKILGYVFSMIPLKKWQDYLIRLIERCPENKNYLATVEEVREIMIEESQCQESTSLWDGFQAKLKEAKATEKSVRSLRWRWAYGAAVLAVLFVATIWIVNTPSFREGQVEERLNGNFRINYIRVEDRAAQPYVYQPQGSHMIIVWAQKNIRGE